MFKAIFGMFLIAQAGSTSARESCDQMRDRIEQQARTKGVRLPIVSIQDKGSTPDGKVVGHCGGGKKIITLRKG